MIRGLNNILRPTSSYLLTIENTLYARSVLLQVLEREVSRGIIPQVAFTICSAVSPTSGCGACIQALYTLRLSEAKRVDVERILLSQSQVILQPKTKVSKFLWSLDCKEFVASCNITSDVDPFPMSDGNYINALNRVIPSELKSILISELNASHIFRHLQCCFMKSKHITDDVISNRLGHNSDSAISSYTHPQLISYFHSHT
jgi:hypothetical protein